MTTDEDVLYPPGDYAIVELFGHQTLVGRIEEIERFGVKMLSIEALYQGTFLPAALYGGSSIYGMTPCSAEIAYKQAPKHLWSLPIALRCIAPPEPPKLITGPDDTGDEIAYQEMPEADPHDDPEEIIF